MLVLIVLFALFHISYALILPIHVNQPFSGRVASAHLHLGTINARPKPKHPPPKPT